jgi:hypothetical protein
MKNLPTAVSRAAHVATACAFALTACVAPGQPVRNGVVGSRHYVEREVPLDAFEALEVDNAIAVTIVAGEDRKAVITAEDNIQPRVRADIADGRLRLRLDTDGVSHFTDHGVSVTLTTSSIGAIRAGGASRVIFVAPTTAPDATLSISATASALIEGAVDAKEVVIDTRDAARVTLRGHVDQLRVSGSSSAVADLRMMTTRLADVSLSGAASATVDARELTCALSDAAALNYIDEPKMLKSTVYDAARLMRAGRIP